MKLISKKGFIGSTLVEELLEEGYKVIIFDDESTGHNFNPIGFFFLASSSKI